MKIKLCWFNQRWNVYLESEGGYNKWETKEVLHKDQDGGMYRLTTYNVEGYDIYTFGLLTHDIRRRPGHGGEWSSNAQNINEVFGVNLTEIGMDRIAASIDIDVLRVLLGPEYKVVPYSCGHEVLSADDSTHEYMQWVTLNHEMV